jgi:carboxyl-terminal processing protease
MTIAFSSRRVSIGILCGFLALSACLGASDRKFSTPPALSTEIRTLVQLLGQAHYNRDSVKNSDYEQVIPDFMGELDGQHLFFLNTDKASFAKHYGNNVYENAAYVGNIDAAYDIFSTYETRTQSRITWIFDELKKDFDLNTNATYRADRTKSDWPANATAADDLWRDRLKFELIAEVLNKKTLDEAKQTVRKRYERMLKNMAEIEGHEIAEIFLTSIARLYDPHSSYLSAESFEDFAIQMKLQLVGIGALLGVEEDNCYVKEIVPGGPADLGRQLKPRDQIIAVAQTGGEPVEVIGMQIRKIVAMIRGSKDTKVRLIVQPADATDPSARREIVITRDVVKLNSARAHAAIFQVPGSADGVTKPVGVISLPSFYGPAEEGDTDATEKTSATQDVARLIEQLTQAGVSALVLDLRHNGGGYLTEAIDLTGLFISRGPVVQVKSYSGDIQVDSDNSDKIAYTGPLAVLVDRFSASASEIVTGALQNYGRAIVIGDSSTHGKGTVQTVVEMKNMVRLAATARAKSGAAKITIQKFYLPGGASTQLKGVVPDIVLPSIDDYLPIGESALPHALVWDQIPSSSFEGSPLDAKIVTSLRQASLERQTKLEEFAYLKKNIEWFKGRQEQKQISLNLDERKRQKADDDAFRKTSKAEREQLAKNDFIFKEFRLGPPLPPKIKAPKKAEDGTPGEDDDNDLSNDDESDTYAKVDIHLRETLRVLSDAVALGQNHDYWASNRPPLTAASKG